MKLMEIMSAGYFRDLCLVFAGLILVQLGLFFESGIKIS